MDEVTILILLALVLPLLIISSFIMVLLQRSQVKLLLGRITRLEGEVVSLWQRPVEAPPSSPTAAAAPPPLTEQIKVAAAPSASTTPVRSALPAMPKVAPPSPPPSPTGPKSSGLEEAFGARIAVWVGGVALAFGGIFLVRYSIEEGLLGPGARVTLGALFSLALLAGGEWLRRNELASPVGGVPVAHIPGIITAAGTTAAFATVYAAYALYGFLSPGVAFVVLALVSVGTMLAAALHGPVLAGLGLLAATALPLLVSSDTPNPWALFAHLVFVSMAAFGVSRIRAWRWLAASAGGAAFAWGALYVTAQAGFSSAPALCAFSAAMIALAAAYHVTAPQREEVAAEPDWTATGIAAAFGLFGVAAAVVEHHRSATIILLGVIVAGLVALALWRRRLAMLVPAAAFLAYLTVFTFDLATWLLIDPTTAFPLPGEANALPLRIGALLTVATAFAALVSLPPLLAIWRRPGEPLWINGARAGGAVAAPLGVLALVYWKVAALAPDLRFAGAALLLGGAFSFVTKRFAGRERNDPQLMSATAATATGAVAAIGLALALGMREGFLTVSLAVLALGIAWVHGSRRIAALPQLAMVVGALVLIRTWLDPLLITQGVSATPIFNEILWVYGLPALAFAASAYLFGRQDSERATALFEALALLFTALLFAFQIRHITTGGQLTAASVSLPELGTQVMSGCLIALGAQRLSLTRRGSVLRIGATIIGALSVFAGGFGLLLFVNPLFSWDSIGNGIIFNALIPGYLLPALAAAALSWFSRAHRPRWYVLGSGILAGLLAFAFISLQVRAAWHRPVLATGAMGAAETYTYSVVWILTGVAVLIAGAATGSRELRLGSAAIIVLAVLKVFLLDMNDLEGVLRALSFMGLGLALVGIGLLYQRLLFPRPQLRE